jgi:DNA polymerase-4
LQSTNDGKIIYELASFIIHNHWRREPVCQVQVTALDPSQGGMQLDFFQESDLERAALNHVVDDINDRYGEFTIAPAPLLHRSGMPNVIAPAWKPEGHRQTILDN